MPAPLPRPLMDDETLQQTSSQVELSWSFLLYMTCSGALAAVALLSSSVPILIGSMVVAPLMPPLALVPFALSARRGAEAWRGLSVALTGLLVAFVAAMLTTFVMGFAGVVAAEAVLLDKPLLEERLRPGWWSMAAAVAAGLAGTTAQAHAKTDAVIGAVASLALVPAVGASAIALFAGAFDLALGGALLLAMNVSLLVGMGILAVLVSAGRAGLRPLLLAPFVVTVLVGAVLVWAQFTDTVPETPVRSSPTATGSQQPPPQGGRDVTDGDTVSP